MIPSNILFKISKYIDYSSHSKLKDALMSPENLLRRFRKTKIYLEVWLPTRTDKDELYDRNILFYYSFVTPKLILEQRMARLIIERAVSESEEEKDRINEKLGDILRMIEEEKRIMRIMKYKIWELKRKK